VIGGYNSSNTQALAGMCAPVLPTYHVEDTRSIEPDTIRHRPLSGGAEVTARDWLPAGPVSIGITSGASTPDSVVGEVVEKILQVRGYTAADLASVAPLADGTVNAR
jgi:4-hydroxy-3-methylbut-2-enyl diphosphate reductase